MRKGTTKGQEGPGGGDNDYDYDYEIRIKIRIVIKNIGGRRGVKSAVPPVTK